MMEQKKCSILTDAEIKTEKPADLYRLHKQRKPFPIGERKGGIRVKYKTNKRKQLKKHIKELTGKDFILIAD